VVSFFLVWRIKPDLVLANGPGTCLPICFSAWILKVLGVIPHSFIALSESYACVYHSSLTTRLLYPFVNILFVQWVSLLKQYPKAVYSGRIPLEPQEIPSSSPYDPNLEKVKSYVLVTVGTTLFEELIHTIDSVKFFKIPWIYRNSHPTWGWCPPQGNSKNKRILHRNIPLQVRPHHRNTKC